jgi:hypothetical protein
MIAATALEHGLAVVTRNVSDFEPAGVNVLDPFGRRPKPKVIEGSARTRACRIPDSLPARAMRVREFWHILAIRRGECAVGAKASCPKTQVSGGTGH